METSLIISLIAIFISTISLVMSFFSFLQQKRQNNNFVRELRVNANKDIMSSHRDLFFEIIKDNDFVTRVAPNPKDVEQFKTEMLGTILINHCEHLFKTAKYNLFSNDDWEGIQNDIMDFFTWSIVKKRWENNRSFYSVEFQNFVDKITKQGRKTDISDAKL